MKFLRSVSSNKVALWVVIGLLILAVPTITLAVDSVIGKMVNLLSPLYYVVFIYIPGWALALVSRVLVWVLSYQGFADEAIITKGWTILRNLSNMFFIIVLVVVAVGTIVKSGRYGYQQNLRRLILMAILINFSKTITLFFIDLSQVITISFVNAFLDAIQGGFPALLGLTGVLSIQDGTNPGDIGGLNVLLQIALGGIMLLVALVVLCVITFLFLMRIIFFAFLIILSPVAFLCSTLPTAQKYYHEWWDMLGKYLVLGPTLAFFLWLSFAVVKEGGTGAISQIINDRDTTTVNIQDRSSTVTAPGSTSPVDESTNPLAKSMIRFFVAISLLFGSLMMAGKLGTVGAGISRQASGKLTGIGKSVLVGRSGSGGLVGTARSLTAAPLRVGATFATNAMDNLTNKGSDFTGRVLGGFTRIVTGSEGAGRAVGGVARTVVKLGAQGLGGAAFQPYLTGSRTFTRADEAAKAKDVKFKTEEAKGKTEAELKRGLSSTDSNARQADAMQYVKKGMMDDPRHNDERTRRAVLDNLKAGGDDTAPEYKEFASSNLDLLKGKDLTDQLDYINQAGEVKKYVTRQVNPTKELLAQMEAAGWFGKDIEEGINVAGKNKREQYQKAYGGSIDSKYTELKDMAEEEKQAVAKVEKSGGDASAVRADYTIKKNDLEKSIQKTRQTAANIDIKNMIKYAVNVDVNVDQPTKIENIENAKTVDSSAINTAALKGIMTNIKGAKLIDIDAESYTKGGLGKYMTEPQFNNLARNGGTTEQMKAALESLIHHAKSLEAVPDAESLQIKALAHKLANGSMYASVGAGEYQSPEETKKKAAKTKKNSENPSDTESNESPILDEFGRPYPKNRP